MKDETDVVLVVLSTLKVRRDGAEVVFPAAEQVFRERLFTVVAVCRGTTYNCLLPNSKTRSQAVARIADCTYW